MLKTGGILERLNDTQKKMLAVLAALLPCLVMGVYLFGVRVLLIAGVAAYSSAVFEWVYEKALHKESRMTELGSAVDGVLLAMMLPANIPLWVPILGAFISSVLLRALFDLLKCEAFAPSAGAKAVLFIALNKAMTTWPLTRLVEPAPGEGTLGSMTGTTPLTQFLETGQATELSRLVIGYVSGNIGEVSAVAVLIGGLFLVWKRVITPGIPLIYIATLFVSSAAYYALSGAPVDPVNISLFHVFAGGTLFGAFFLTGDLMGDDGMDKADIIYAIGLGIVTLVIRVATPFPEWGALAFVIMGMVRYLIRRSGKAKGGKNE